MNGAAQSGIYCSYSDVAPNFSSALNSVGNSIGAVAGIVGPLVVAAFTDSYEGVWGWRMFFFVTNIFVILSLISWSIYQTSVPVPELNTPTPRHTYKSI
jgi:MFS family permease